MLSFLREQGIGDSSVQETAKSTRGGPDEKPQEQEYLTVSAKNKNVRKSTILLAALFCVGLLCLWFMIKKSSPQTASAGVVSTEETQIEKAMAQLTGMKSEMFNQMDGIVNKFYEFSDVLQVRVGELAKNPFELELFLAHLTGKSKAEKQNFDIDLEMLRQQQLKQQSTGMQLWSIMQSDHGKCCMINDKILYEGDLIKGFKVIKIGDSSVKLESEGLEMVLKLSE